MFSRIRENVQHVFDCFCEVAPAGFTSPINKQQSGAEQQQPWIVSKFPDSYCDDGTLKMVPMFVFPCEFDRSTVQHSSFVLTSLDSKWTFGFCRHSVSNNTALVLLSALPWHDAFFKLLNTLATLSSSTTSLIPSSSAACASSSPASSLDSRQAMVACLQRVYAAPVPERGGPLSVKLSDGAVFSAVCADHLGLPCIPQDRNLTEYFNAVDSHNMMVVFASMLYERRIVVTSRRLSRLSSCVQAANAIIYPMSWQHIFIPILPATLIDYLSAPMPFLIGVPSVLMRRVRPAELGDAVVLDADANRVTSPYHDLDSLPDEVVVSLRRNLKNPNNMLGDRVARCFLRALVQLIGGYRDALRFPHNCSKITFDGELFVRSRPPHMQPFLEEMLQLQIFDQFISERLDMLNSGQGFSDEFELEACMHLEKCKSSRLSKQYRDWLSSVKKDGGALLKNFRSITNPALKSAVRNVIETSRTGKQKVRSAYRDLRGRIKDSHTHTMAECNAEDDGGSSVPGSPTSGRHRSTFHSGSDRPASHKKLCRVRASAATSSMLERRISSCSSSPNMVSPRHCSASPSIHYDIIDSSLPLGSEPTQSTVDELSGFFPTSSSNTLVDEVTAALSNMHTLANDDLITLDSPQFSAVDAFDPLKMPSSSTSSPANHCSGSAQHFSSGTVNNPIYTLPVPVRRQVEIVDNGGQVELGGYLLPDGIAREEGAKPSQHRTATAATNSSFCPTQRRLRTTGSSDNLLQAGASETDVDGSVATRIPSFSPPSQPQLPPRSRALVRPSASSTRSTAANTAAAVMSDRLAESRVLHASPALVPPRPVFRSVASLRAKYEACGVQQQSPSPPPPLPPRTHRLSNWTTFD